MTTYCIMDEFKGLVKSVHTACTDLGQVVRLLILRFVVLNCAQCFVNLFHFSTVQFFAFCVALWDGKGIRKDS